MDVQKNEDWYRVKTTDVYKHGGKKLLQHYYDDTLYKVQRINGINKQALMYWYPELPLVPWMFEQRVKPGFWNNRDNHLRFFEWTGVQLGYKCLEDWYNVTPDDIYEFGGGALLDNYYSDSPMKALVSVYKEHNWIMWKFKHLPTAYWGELDNQKMFFDWVKTQLNLANMEEWYEVSTDYICEQGGRALLNIYYSGSLSNALKTVYPQHVWKQISPYQATVQ